MSKKITYVLEYRENGEAKNFPIDIDLISNRVIREYSEWQATVVKTSSLWDRISDLNTEIGSLKKEGNSKGLIAIKNIEIEEIKKELSEIGKSDFFNKRFELIKRILIDNKVKEEKFLSFEFWDECVDPNAIIEFLILSINKDFDGKKKI